MSESTKLLICPACGAPLDPQPGEAIVKCAYCGNSTLLPSSMRSPITHGDFASSATGFNAKSMLNQASRMKEVVELVRNGRKIEAIKLFRELTSVGLKEAKDAVDTIEAGKPFAMNVDSDVSSVNIGSGITIDARNSNLGRWIGCGVVLLVVGILVSTLVPTLAIIPFFASFSDSSAIELPPAPTSVLPPEVQEPFTPSFANLTLSFGEKGQGAGMFDDPRYVAVDGSGNIYVGDYQDGRVQVFDSQGGFQRQINIGDTILRGMAVSPGGNLYLAFNGEVYFYDSNGQPQGTLAYDDYIDSIALGADGSLYVVIDGDTLLRFNPGGSLTLEIPAAISGITNDSELDTSVAVDGLGNIYALGSFNSAVFIYNPEGTFVDRFGGDTTTPARGVDPGRFQAVDAIAVDGYGRIFVSDIWGVQIFASDGQYIDYLDIDGVAFGMAFDLQNNLYIASNRGQVFKYEIEKP